MLIGMGLNRQQVVALWSKAQEALIPQGEFFEIVNRSGAAALLVRCSERGVLNPSKPARAEMDFEHMLHQEYLTPNSLFFTFSHSYPPPVDIKSWRLSIEGDGVEKPFSLNYDDLLKLPSVTVTRYLECAGNGRAFYASLLKKEAQGPQWHFGGYGIAEWTGVRMAELLRMAGIKPEAVAVMPVGLDSPPGERPMPVAKAMEEDTILAYIMNGQILPPDHGFPLRAILPGWVGVANIKWVSRIVVSTQPLHVIQNTQSYVLIGPDYVPQPPARGPVITTQLVKSACCLPWPATLNAGHQKIVGYAWSPFGKIAKVEVSINGGTNFQPTNLVGPNIERAGTRWEFHFHPGPGDLTITPRATDDKGNTQYDISGQKWNQLGYLFGAMVPHPVKVSEHKSVEELCYEDSSVTMPGCC